MKKIFSTILCFFIILISCKKAEVDDGRIRDYREKFYGDYNCLVRTTYSSMGQFSVDSAYKVVKVRKFEGFNTTAGKNYHDIEHKVGILVNEPFDPNSPSGSCNGVAFYFQYYYHPTITLNGVLSYPEFDCSYHVGFYGKMINDSIQIGFSFGSLGLTWTQSIVGVKIK
ncbi:MAG TPA: hypothetical protein PKM97_02425 [Bacteroidia bacterium]|nr:hypothetical protein [Bacteroidia bacterium]